MAVEWAATGRQLSLLQDARTTREGVGRVLRLRPRPGALRRGGEGALRRLRPRASGGAPRSEHTTAGERTGCRHFRQTPRRRLGSNSTEAGWSGILSVGAPPPEGSLISTERNYVRPDPSWRGRYVGNRRCLAHPAGGGPGSGMGEPGHPRAASRPSREMTTRPSRLGPVGRTRTSRASTDFWQG